MSEVFKGKAVLVTGGSSGIGRAIAIELGRCGADVWLVGRSQADLADTATAIAGAGGPQAIPVSMDLRQRGPLRELIEKIGSQHPHLFAVINNAGVMFPEPIMEGTLDRWQAMLDINVMAQLEGSQAAVNAMRAHGKPGHVINIGSVQGRFEEPGVYGISKKAAEMIGETLRKELEHDDIRVATVILGGFATQLSRGFNEQSLKNIASNLETLGIERTSPEISRIVGDPQHVANVVRYILEQPIDINLHEVFIRPPISTKA
jgi:NADP-dependent 3-hydroxy acid dehydrogenase YdfG